MAFFWSVIIIVLMVMQFRVCQQLEFNRINISCNDIRAEHSRGFTFLYKCSTAIDVFGHYNQTVIAHAKPQEDYYNWSTSAELVISMDKSSIVMTKCINLKIQCFLYDGQHHEETWEEFEVTESSPVANEVTPPWNLIIGLSLSVMLIIGMLLCYYWRNAIMSRFVGSLPSCCCHRDGGCCVSCPSRGHENDANHDSTTVDVETLQDVSLVEMCTPEPRGSDGNKDNTPGTIQANGNLKDDPGGTSAVRTMNLNNGCTHGDRGPEGQPLLEQRAAVHSSDMTVVAVALVNKHDFDPDRVGMCSTTQIRQ